MIEVPRIFQDWAVVSARLSIWNKKLATPLAKLRGAALQKVSASDDGFLVLVMHSPSEGKSIVVLSISKKDAGIFVGNERPPSQPKPNSIVQVMRKYMVGRRVKFASASIDPTSVIMEFDDKMPADLDERERLIAPDCLILDLDSKPVKVIVAKKYFAVPERYESSKQYFHEGTPFYESFCEWSLDATKTKRRPSFEKPLLEFCVLGSYEKEELPIDEPKPQFVVAARESSVPASVEAKPEPTFAKLTGLFPTHLRRAIKTRLQFLERRILKQKGDLPVETELNQLEKRSEALRAHLYMWPQGSPIWYVPPHLIEEGLPPILKLSAGKKPGDLLDEFFDETERLKKTRKFLLHRISESTKAVEHFQLLVMEAGTALEDALNQAPTSQFKKEPSVFSHQLPPQVERLCELLEVAWTEGAQKKKRMQDEESRRLPYRSYVASSGEFVRVAKSASDGDAMIRLMPGHHFWLHVLSGEGSHVWLESPKKKTPSDEAIREAAVLAIYHSKYGRGMEGEVRVTTRSSIEKKKDLPPGKVLVRRCETIVVRFTEAELNRVLANAI